MMVPVREYASASEMVVNLMAIRRGLFGKPVIEAMPPPPEPEQIPKQMPPAIQCIIPPTDIRDRFPTIAQIVNIVSDVWNIAPVHILSSRRTWDCIVPRHVVCALAYRLTTRSLPEIGRRIGRDHSTVLHARNKLHSHMERIEVRLPPNATVRQWAEEMLKEVGTGSVKQRRENGA